MGQSKRRYVARGVTGGWKIWDNKRNRWWGELYERQPDELVIELNGNKNPTVITDLTRMFQKDKR